MRCSPRLLAGRVAFINKAHLHAGLFAPMLGSVGRSVDRRRRGGGNYFSDTLQIHGGRVPRKKYRMRDWYVFLYIPPTRERRARTRARYLPLAAAREFPRSLPLPKYIIAIKSREDRTREGGSGSRVCRYDRRRPRRSHRAIAITLGRTRDLRKVARGTTRYVLSRNAV